MSRKSITARQQAARCVLAEAEKSPSGGHTHWKATVTAVNKPQRIVLFAGSCELRGLGEALVRQNTGSQ